MPKIILRLEQAGDQCELDDVPHCITVKQLKGFMLALAEQCLDNKKRTILRAYANRGAIMLARDGSYACFAHSEHEALILKFGGVGVSNGSETALMVLERPHVTAGLKPLSDTVVYSVNDPQNIPDIPEVHQLAKSCVAGSLTERNRNVLLLTSMILVAIGLMLCIASTASKDSEEDLRLVAAALMGTSALGVCCMPLTICVSESRERALINGGLFAQTEEDAAPGESTPFLGNNLP